jgi:hypothetical protein
MLHADTRDAVRLRAETQQFAPDLVTQLIL